MGHQRFNAYRSVWIFVFFDLPTETKADSVRYRKFVKNLEHNGFTRFQYSIFFRHCPSQENMKVHAQRVKGYLPSKGHVGILHITDKQFEMMEVFFSSKKEELPPSTQQLELF
jgi:CRISPR-associated protein Cas2